MQAWAEQFYKSKAWQECRRVYKNKARGLCERCLTKGIITPGEIVHHKVHLTERNIRDPNVSLNFNNLELVCRDCHALYHAKKTKRFKVKNNGDVELL